MAKKEEVKEEVVFVKFRALQRITLAADEEAIKVGEYFEVEEELANEIVKLNLAEVAK